MTQTVLITGANRGIGLEFATQYARDGYHVIGTCRTPDKADALKAAIGVDNVYALDVSSTESVHALKGALGDQKIDILINNAGIYGPKSGIIGSPDMNDDIWIQAFKTNAIGPFRVVEALLPLLQKGVGKKVANISSRMGSVEDNTSGRSYLYRSSKAAMNAISKSLAIDLAAYDIAVCVMHPGYVKTDMTGHNGAITTTESVNGLRKTIDHLSLSDAGKFFHADGSILPW